MALAKPYRDIEVLFKRKGIHIEEPAEEWEEED
jgi:hypothetical protein